jgi:multiple antibiotic resistance protein
MPDFNIGTVFLMLFLMIGPIKIILPFAAIANQLEPAALRRVTTKAIAFAAVMLTFAAFFGGTMMENFKVSLPVLALTGGIVLTMAALRMVFQQPSGLMNPEAGKTGLPAIKPAQIAYPMIVTPHGIAAVILFSSLSKSTGGNQLTVFYIVILVLLLDWVVMIFIKPIAEWASVPLQILAVVLGVVQVALGIRIILLSLSIIWRDGVA